MTSKRKNEAKRWFHQAFYDLEATRWNIEGAFYDTACFLAQQSGEKALKSLLYSVGARRSALFTHSLVEMIQAGAKSIKALNDLLDEARELDLHYVPSRYPNGIPSGYPHQFYGKKIADQALLAAEKIFSAVQDHFRETGERDIWDVESNVLNEKG